MALDYVSVASNLNGTYTTLKTPTIQDNPNQNPYPDDPSTLWMDNYITYYDNDSNNGVFSVPAVVMVNAPEDLRFDNNLVACDGDTLMAAKIADYWSAQTTPGTPQIDSITGISNDAQKIRPIIEGFLCSRVSVESSPPYEELFNFIETQVKTIIWTVTEASGSYTVTIS